jgi:hypothetical protein
LRKDKNKSSSYRENGKNKENMALKDWMIAFNNAKTMESNGEEGQILIEEYEHVLEKLGEGPFTEAEENVRKEVCRNLCELYALNGDEAKAEEYRKMSE